VETCDTLVFHFNLTLKTVHWHCYCCSGYVLEKRILSFSSSILWEKVWL